VTGSKQRPADLALEPLSPSSGIMLDDDDGDHAGPSAGLVIASDGDPGARATARFGDPMAIAFADAQRIGDGDLETHKVLGLIDRDALDELNDAEVQAQVARFCKKLRALEMQFGDLQKARGRLPGYRSWLERVTALERAPDAARRFRAIVEAEEREGALDELATYIEFVLDDKLLEWAEHRKVVRKAEGLGLGEADVEAIYRRFEPFERESRAVAERAAATGWTPHPRLAIAGEVYAWNLQRLRDSLLAQFEAAVEIANQPFDKTYSLYDYLDRNRDDGKAHALHARAAAEQASTPALAVWYFLWTTGPAILHLGSKEHRPVRTRRRQLASVSELLALAATDWIIDDLARALEGGLLENWLFVVTRDDTVFRIASTLRQDAYGVPSSQRATFLCQAAIRVLWHLGLTGLPLRDDAKRVVLVEDVGQLVAQAETCWDALDWTLHSGVLAAWLDRVAPAQAVRARACVGIA